MTAPATVQPDHDHMKAWRHQLHRHPELGFEEVATSRLVAERLAAWGYEVHTGIAATGVVGVLRWGDGQGPSLGLRADMDALPIHEQTGLPWASQVPGRMHACGHDGHTAILLGAAEALSRRHRDHGLPGGGTLILIFQPAEELGGGGGAQRMIEEGLLERFPCDALYALHNYPGKPTGHFYFREGPFLASSDKVMITFTGRSGHGAMPQLAVDPTLPAAATVMALQSIVGRNVDPNLASVISVGRLQAGNAYNIIPETAELELSVRTLDPEVRDTLERRIRAVAQSQADGFDCSCEVRYERGYPVLVNAPDATRLAVDTARELFGEARLEAPAAPLTASEDFAFFLEQVPGCYLMIGNGDNGHAHGSPIGPCSVHNPHYDFNDECLTPAAAFWLGLVTRYFDASATPSS